MKKLAIVGLIVCSPTFAGDFSYTEVTIGYTSGTIFSDAPNVGDMTYNAVALSACLDLQNGFGVYATTTNGSGESTVSDYYGIYDVDANISTTGLGILYHQALSASADIVVGAGTYQGDVEMIVDGYNLGSESGSGTEVWVGVRAMAGPIIETNVMLTSSRYEGEPSSSVEAGIYLSLDQKIKAGLRVNRDVDGGAQSATITARAGF